MEETKILTTVRKVHGTNRPWYEKSGIQSIHASGQKFGDVIFRLPCYEQEGFLETADVRQAPSM